MTHRTDPQVYHVDIVEKKTGDTKRAEVAAWWSGEASIDTWRRMCDCQLAAYRGLTTDSVFRSDWPSGSGRFPLFQREYLKDRGCNHKPSRKFQVARAYLPDERVIEL